MKKFALIIGILIILLTLSGVIITNINNKVVYLAESEELNNELNNLDIKISPHIRFMAMINGGYHKLYLKTVKEGYGSRDAMNYISDGLGDKLYNKTASLNIEPINATVIFTKDYNKPFEYTDEKYGQIVNIGALCEDTAISLDKDTEISIKMIKASPLTFKADLIEQTSLRGEFNTSYATSSENRKNNVAVAANYLNGHIIEPLDIMSFNSAVGPRTVNRGFRIANIIFNGKMILGVGGGVCQVSSTLYNTCLLSGLNVLNSKRHSRTVPYIPASQDAMVSEISDLVVENNSKYPVYFVTSTNGKIIKIAIYGMKMNEEYKIRSSIISTIPAKADKITVEGGDKLPSYLREALESNDPMRLRNIPYRETIVKESIEGLISEAYLDRYINGVLIDSELVSHDIYSPQQGEIVRSLI